MSDFRYVGAELELFACAHNWKAYWSRHVRPFVVGDVLEVGAGIGSNTRFLDPGGDGRWVCLEPDPRLIAQLTEDLATQSANSRPKEAVCGNLQSLDSSQRFDTIVYIDVLEHIENDREELENAASRLVPGGRIIVLAPAYQSLFTPFDAAIGHFRRYNRRMLREISPAGFRLEQVVYLDSLGIALSAANLLLLRQSMPTKAQLRFWDQCVIPVSRVLDRCFFHSLGRSILGVWKQG
jgi:SAM-dependent methyltransferase